MTKDPKKLTPLNWEDLESIYKGLSNVTAEYGCEPFPPFSSCDRKKLDSAIKTVESSFFGFARYKDIYEKSAAYLYYVNKSHSVMNGNKRFSVVCFSMYLFKNGYYFEPGSVSLTAYAVVIAQSNDSQKDSLITEIAREFRDEDCIQMYTEEKQKIIEDNWDDLRQALKE